MATHERDDARATSITLFRSSFGNGWESTEPWAVPILSLGTPEGYLPEVARVGQAAWDQQDR